MIDTGVLLEVLTSNKNELANGFGYATAVKWLFNRSCYCWWECGNITTFPSGPKDLV
ncbi:MAG: hypothetical protein R2805_03470 [Flavobacterium sp.]|uniref:hypothetical protein n=1 Tax=Flavobacterium sp. TaxID=239 RepID=UPI0035281A8C